MIELKKYAVLLLVINYMILFPSGISAENASSSDLTESASASDLRENASASDLMVVDKENNTITYVSPEETDDVNVKVYEKFNDVEEDDWYVSYLSHLVQLGIINGFGGDVFAPYDYMTRAEFVTVLAYTSEADLAQYKGESSFSDVSASAWYARQVEWAHQNGLIQGRKQGFFDPESPIAREEAAILMYRYAKMEDGSMAQSSMSGYVYTDEADISSWAREDVDAMSVAGVFCGDETQYFHPRYPLLRAECVKIFSAYIINDTKPTFYFPGGGYIEYLGDDDAENMDEGFQFDMIYIYPLIYCGTQIFPFILFLVPVFTIVIVILSKRIFYKGLSSELSNGFFIVCMCFSLISLINYFLAKVIMGEATMGYAFWAGLSQMIAIISFIGYLVRFSIRLRRRK
jgi:hypothetical protein